MVDPITSLTLKNHPLGNEARVEWVLPDSLPDEYRIVIFKDEASIPDAVIDDFFAGDEVDIPVSAISPDSSGNIVDGVVDMNVETGKTYYYRVAIEDTAESEHSITVDESITITSTFESEVIDCKNLVIDAIKRLFKNHNMAPDEHYEIRRQWTMRPIKMLTLHVVRAPGNIVQRYMGDTAWSATADTVIGETEEDNIEVVWEDPGHKRIDSLTNLFRGSKSVLRRYLRQAGVHDAEIIMGGDAINANFKDRIQPTASMMIRCTIEITETFNNKTTHSVKDGELRIIEE